MFRSIKFKLALLYSFVLLLTLVVFVLLVVYHLNRKLRENLDSSLKAEVIWIRDAIEPKVSELRFIEPYPDTTLEDEIWEKIYEHTLLSSKKQFIQIIDSSGKEIYRSLSLGSSDLPFDTLKMKIGEISLFTIENFNTHKIRLAVLRSKYLTIGVAYPLNELDQVISDLVRIFIFLIPVAFLFSIAGGFFLANRSLKPVDEVINVANEITAQNLNRRIPEPRTSDEIARLVKTFNKMIERLEQSFVEMRQFTADISHELKTPLTIIRGEIEVALGRKKNSAECKKILANVLDEVIRISSMVENLLTLFKSETGQLEIKFKRVSLSELILDLIEDAKILAREKGIKIKVDSIDDVYVNGDELKLRQMFLNIVDNAIKYNVDGGFVSISVKRSDGFVNVQVSDTGIGIPQEEIDFIFRRFYRVDKARSRDSGGVGLGLSIAKRIAELHGGEIKVESEVGRGSKFIIILPVLGRK